MWTLRATLQHPASNWIVGDLKLTRFDKICCFSGFCLFSFMQRNYRYLLFHHSCKCFVVWWINLFFLSLIFLQTKTVQHLHSHLIKIFVAVSKKLHLRVILEDVMYDVTSDTLQFCPFLEERKCFGLINRHQQ